MRSLDTNVLVRYVAADEPAQTASAEKMIEECLAKRERVFLPALVLCELVWVLARVYRLRKAEIVQELEQILEKDLLVFEHDELVRRAVESYRRGSGDLADYLIREISQSAGCRDTVTFDLGLRGEAGFTVLS